MTEIFQLLSWVGTEGAEAITHITCSNDGKLLAMCERFPQGQRGRVTIFEIISSRTKQVFPDGIDQQNQFKSNEFICSAFSEKKTEVIVTLCGEPDWLIMLWNHETQRFIKSVPVGLNIPQTVTPKIFQVSFNPFDPEGNSFLLTGPCNTFKYIRKDQDNNLTIELTQIHEMDQGRKISNNFTCHAWSQSTGHVLVCTDNGEMIVCENNGQYKAYVLDSIQGTGINACIPLSNGFLIAQGPSFSIYRTSHVDERSPLKLQG